VSQLNEKSRVRNVTAKDLIVAVLVVSYLLAALVILKFHSRLVGGVLLGLAGAAVLVWLVLLPKQQKAAIGAEILKQERTPIGKAMKLVEYALLAFLGIALISWFLSKFGGA